MSAVLETPSKAAASALSSIDLSSPANLAPKLADSAKQVVVKPTREELEARFVGDIDCEEEDEPILQET